MPKATNGGVSDQSVDPDYVAPAGVAPQDAIDAGIPNQGADDANDAAGRPADDTSRQGPQQDSSKIREQADAREHGDSQAQVPSKSAPKKNIR